MYDSSTGRFITRDPIKDGRNWYVYCGNDPLGCADDSGNSAKWIVKIFEKRGNDIVEIIYHIIPGIGKRPAKSYAKSLDGVKDIRWDNGHKGGPPHYHNEAKPEIHITSEGYADEATTPPWNHWRDIGKFIGGFIDPTPISAAIEGGEEAGRQIDPWVKEMQQRRSRAASWWMEE